MYGFHYSYQNSDCLLLYICNEQFNELHTIKAIYDNLVDEVKYHTTKDTWGNDKKIDMWYSDTFLYSGKWETYYYTSYHWTVE